MSKNPKNTGKPSRAEAAPAGAQTNSDRANAPAPPQNPAKAAPGGDHTKRLGNHNQLPHRDPSGARGNEDRRGGAEVDRTKR